MKLAKLILGVLLQCILIIAVFIVGLSASMTRIDLKKAQKSTGVIIDAEIKQTRGSKAIPGQKDLIIHITGTDAGFWIYRMGNRYEVLQGKLNVGKIITIYYSQGLGSNNYYTVYQVESNHDVLYSKDEYQRKERMAGNFIALPGALLMTIFLVYDTRKKLRAMKGLKKYANI